MSVVAAAIFSVKINYSNESITRTIDTTYHFKFPDEFNLKKPLSWRCFIKRFNMFRNAIGLFLKTRHSTDKCYCIA